MKQLILTFTIFVLLQSNLSAQLVPTTKGFGKCGYCKEGTKEFVVRAKYDRCSKVEHGTMIVTKNNYDALIDTFGNKLIDFKYVSLRYNGHNILAFDIEEKGYMLYDLKGIPLLNKYIDGISRLDTNSRNFILVDNKKYGMLTEKGETIHSMVYDSIFQTNNFKYYFFKENDKLGIMNVTGSIIHAPIFDKVNKISNDSIMVKKDGEWYIWSSIDSTFTKGKLKDPVADILPCYDCSSCPQYGLNPRNEKHCSLPKMLYFIYTNLEFPSLAKNEKKDGDVIVDFIVNTDGSTSEFEVKEKLGYGLDEAAINVCKKLKFDRAATFDGEFIPMKYTIPIKFKLE
ncbi:MAG TPA: energy transducer TonB [Saprospiraceae bacterium]|nr:energy transducer TonB [Saprospiraceae bacterium]HMU03757.1 energy transducer TonB [Saprospiraceae bacterium]